MNIMKINEIKEYLKTVSSNSGDPHKKVGCFIMSNKFNILSVGYNKLPKNLKNLSYKDENDKTRPEVLHAEIVALGDLMQYQNIHSYENDGELIKERRTLYTTLSPCMECARMIVASGIINNVYYLEEYKDTKPLEFLRQNKIKIKQI